MLDWKDLDDIEIHNIDPRDYPDFANATVLKAWNNLEGRECTDEELDYINDNFSGDINEYIHTEIL